MAKPTKKIALNWDEFSTGSEEKPATVYDQIKAEKEGIFKALAAGRSYKSTADYLTAAGIAITPGTLKSYLSKIRKEEKEALKNAPVSEEKTGENLKISEGENLAGSDKDQEPEAPPVEDEKIEKPVGKCWCGAETSRFSLDGKLYEKCSLYDSDPVKENHLSPVRIG